jgi:hypothetical protein
MDQYARRAGLAHSKGEIEAKRVFIGPACFGQLVF